MYARCTLWPLWDVRRVCGCAGAGSRRRLQCAWGGGCDTSHPMIQVQVQPGLSSDGSDNRWATGPRRGRAVDALWRTQSAQCRSKSAPARQKNVSRVTRCSRLWASQTSHSHPPATRTANAGPTRPSAHPAASTAARPHAADGYRRPAGHVKLASTASACTHARRSLPLSLLQTGTGVTTYTVEQPLYAGRTWSGRSKAPMLQTRHPRCWWMPMSSQADPCSARRHLASARPAWPCRKERLAFSTSH